MNEKLAMELKLIKDYVELIQDKGNYIMLTMPSMNPRIKEKLDYLLVNNKLNKIMIREILKCED